MGAGAIVCQPCVDSGRLKIDESAPLQWKPYELLVVATNGNIAFVQLGSSGDLISLLPIMKHHADAGNQVDIYTQPAFAPVLDSVSYAKAIPVKRNIRECMAVAKEIECQYDEVIVTQSPFNETRPARATTNYQTEAWERCGLLEKFHDLPTVIDKRDWEGELAAIREWMPNSRPMLAYNLSGVSSPYAHADEQREWIKQTFGRSHCLIDLGALHLKSVMHLLPFLEAAEALITVDTATVHLAHAAMTPTVVFLPENKFSRSEPRQHWVYACTHDESIGIGDRENIHDIIRLKDYRQSTMCRPITAMHHPYVFHAVNYWWDEGEDKAKVMAAYPSWEQRRLDLPGFRTVFHEVRHGAGPETLLTDVIDRAVEQTQHGGDVILHASRHAPIPFEAIEPLRHIASGIEEVSPGCFAFAAAWWRQNREYFQHVACEGCEEAMRMIGVAGNLVLAV
jgi:hypothetical protein